MRAPKNPLSPEVRDLTRTLRDRTRYLRQLVANIDQYIDWMDREMAKPEPDRVKRGSRIAQALNALDMANQGVKRFGLPQRKRTVKR